MPLNKDYIREVGAFRWFMRTGMRQFHKRVARRDHAMRLPNGERIWLPISNHFASEAYVTKGDVDWGSEKLLYSLLSRKGVLLDVGAHIGYYALYMCTAVKAVYCFEPDPRVREYLQRNIAGKADIHAVSVALGSRPGKALFTLEDAAEESHLSAASDLPGRQIEVDVMTIDDFARQNDLWVEAIKMDVEGFDTDVIRGAENILRTQRPIVLTEAKPDGALFELTGRASYRVFAFIRKPMTRRKWFGELFLDVPIPGATKMLFLVPDHLVSEIVKLAD